MVRRTYGRDLPPMASYQIDMSSETTIQYSLALPVGIVPRTMGRYRPVALQAAIILRLAESGSDATNYSKCQVLMGTTASYSVIATLDTSGGPAALERISVDMKAYLDSGVTIWAYWTRIGSARNYNGQAGFLSLEILMERMP